MTQFRAPLLVITELFFFECWQICHPYCHIIYGQEQMNTDEVFKQFVFII